MCKRSPFDVSGRPVDVPRACLQGTPLTDYVALLQRLHEVQRELADERARRVDAENAAWGKVAERLRAVERGLAACLEDDDRGRLRAEVVRLLERLSRIWDEEGMEFVDATGRRIDDVSTDEFEVLTTCKAERPEDDGLIVETWRPASRRRGTVVCIGQLVVARWQPDPLEDTL